MKLFKSIREGNYVEPGVSQIDDAPEDPLSFVEIKPKKTKVVKEGTYSKDVERAFPGGKASGVKTGVSAPKGTSTMPKDKDLQRAMTAVPKKPADEYDRKVTSYLKKKYNEETVIETKGAPKGFHFTKDGKLKRGDANQDGNGGPMLRSDPLDKQRNKIPAVSEKVEPITSKDIKMAVGVAKDKRYAGGNMTGAVKTMEKMKPGLSKHPRVQQVLKSTNEGIDFLKIWNGIKPVHEAIKTTHEDPLVVTKDAEGHIHTHANLSVANAIHGTDVKHQAIHTGKPVQGGKYTFELSKHHEGALKEDAPFDAVAHKKEHDRLMGKHIEAHKAVSKAFADMRAQGKSPRFDIPENDKLNSIKKEIAAHKDKVPRGPAAKPGSAAHYYASKKPGEYTGD